MPDHLLSAAACAEIAARAAKATAGPWVECRPGQPCPQIFAGVKKLGEILREPDMVFVLNAREEIPALLATVAALRESFGAVLEYGCTADGTPYDWSPILKELMERAAAIYAETGP